MQKPSKEIFGKISIIEKSNTKKRAVSRRRITWMLRVGGRPCCGFAAFLMLVANRVSLLYVPFAHLLLVATQSRKLSKVILGRTSTTGRSNIKKLAVSRRRKIWMSQVGLPDGYAFCLLLWHEFFFVCVNLHFFTSLCILNLIPIQSLKLLKEILGKTSIIGRSNTKRLVGTKSKRIPTSIWPDLSLEAAAEKKNMKRKKNRKKPKKSKLSCGMIVCWSWAWLYLCLFCPLVYVKQLL